MLGGMSVFTVPMQIRWADIDQNRHLRHSAYYDYGATVRMLFLNEHGLTTDKMEQLGIGPVLFREEAKFRREIKLEDRITVDLQLIRARADFSRWTMHHRFMKTGDTLAASVEIDGAWMDLVKRKLIVPDDFIQGVFRAIPAAAEMQWLEK